MNDFSSFSIIFFSFFFFYLSMIYLIKFLINLSDSGRIIIYYNHSENEMSSFHQTSTFSLPENHLRQFSLKSTSRIFLIDIIIEK